MDDLDFSIDPNSTAVPAPEAPQQQAPQTKDKRSNSTEPSGDKYTQMSDQLHTREQQAKERLKAQAVR